MSANHTEDKITYSKDKELHYGEDPVHPNEAGMKLMADLWAEALFMA